MSGLIWKPLPTVRTLPFSFSVTIVTIAGKVLLAISRAVRDLGLGFLFAEVPFFWGIAGSAQSTNTTIDVVTTFMTYVGVAKASCVSNKAAETQESSRPNLLVALVLVARAVTKTRFGYNE